MRIKPFCPSQHPPRKARPTLSNSSYPSAGTRWKGRSAPCLLTSKRNKLVSHRRQRLSPKLAQQKRAVPATRRPSLHPRLCCSFNSFLFFFRGEHYILSLLSSTTLLAAVMSAELFTEQWAPMLSTKATKQSVITALSNSPVLLKIVQQSVSKISSIRKHNCSQHSFPSASLHPPPLLPHPGYLGRRHPRAL